MAKKCGVTETKVPPRRIPLVNLTRANLLARAGGVRLHSNRALTVAARSANAIRMLEAWCFIEELVGEFVIVRGL